MRIELSEIKKLKETQHVEFKKSLSLQKEGAQSLCGMVNTDSAVGNIFFGLADDGTLVGLTGNLDTAQKNLASHIRQQFDPSLSMDIHLLTCEDKDLILMKGQRAKSVAFHEYDGRAYIREGSSKRVLSIEEKDRLNKSRNRDNHNGPWVCDQCGSMVGQLSILVITGKGPTKAYNCSCGGEFYPA